MAEHPEWYGHRLTSLPAGESWLSGGERRTLELPNAAVPQMRSARPGVTPATRAEPARTTSKSGTITLVLLGIAALVTIIIGRLDASSGSSGPSAVTPAESGPVVSGLYTDHLTAVRVHVGDYIRFQLPDDRTYTPVVEQVGGGIPAVEALALPGQLPQLRADATGHAVVEVTAEPVCSQPDGCPDQRKLLGGVDVTVTP